MKWHRKLKALGACDSAVEWAKGYKTFRGAWRACECGDWMLWLLDRLDCWPDGALAEHERVAAQARAEYERVAAQARAEYERVAVPAWAEYKRVDAQALAEYERVEAQAWAEYERVTADAIRPLGPVAEAALVGRSRAGE